MQRWDDMTGFSVGFYRYQRQNRLFFKKFAQVFVGSRLIFPKMMLLFELSGENPTLPCAEIECVASVIDSRPQVAVAECPQPQEARRLAMTHVVLEYLGECAPDSRSFRDLLSDLSITTSQPFAGRAKLIHESCQEKNTCSQREFERLIGTMITGPVPAYQPGRRIPGYPFHRPVLFRESPVPDRSRRIRQPKSGPA